VNPYVIDASIAVKWVVEETGTVEALSLRRQGRLIAPELLVAECANILWKKVRRQELSKDEAVLAAVVLAAGLLQRADVELQPTRSLLSAATSIAIELDHPAYDCVYIALAIANDCSFVTADESFIRKLSQGRRAPFRERALSLAEAVARE
jgi:predicted nucleic acid-binding protein